MWRSVQAEARRVLGKIVKIDYPTPNFIRNSMTGMMGFGKGVSLDDNSKLTIRLHYNPVMDEWVSLTDESTGPRTQDADIMFDLHKREVDENDPDNDEEVISIAYFLECLEKTGIRRNDPRLKEMIKNLDEIRRETRIGGIGALSYDFLLLDRNTFKTAIDPCISLLSRAFKRQFVIPEFHRFCKQIDAIYDHCKDNDDGTVANYIPQLARYSPNYWGVSICTVDGQRYSLGDVNVPFTMQSCSKPFTYGVCLEELGAQTVHQYVGQEPSGRMFNELSLDFSNKPHNPMLNAGAIMTSSLLLNLVHPDMKMSEKFDFVENYLRRISGGEFFSFNNSVFLSEKDTADRNFALAYYMKENKCFPKGFALQECLDFYFQTCSLELNCETLAVMGATLANGGECPITGEATLSPGTIRDVLSLMHSCGMYNYSGKFAFNVGLPAKSAVSGALVLVIPNVMGIGLWSPPLDALGNSCRGVQFSREFTKVFNFHRFDNLVTLNKQKIDPRVFSDERVRQQILCILYSATTGDLTALKRFYYSNENMKAKNYDSRTALHLAASEGHLSCVKFLVETCQLSALEKDRWGFTPLGESKRFGHDIIFRYLAKYLEDNCPEDLATFQAEYLDSQ